MHLGNHIGLTLLIWHSVFCLVNVFHFAYTFNKPPKDEKQAIGKQAIRDNLKVLQEMLHLSYRTADVVGLFIVFLVQFFTFRYFRNFLRDFIVLPILTIVYLFKKEKKD